MFSPARDILLRAVTDRVTPGAIAEVGSGTAVLWRQAVGRLTYDDGSPPVDDATRYDLASLTKVLATAMLTAQAVDRGVLSLEDPVADRVPAWERADRAGVTIEDLLAHASGLEAWAPLYRDARGTRDVVRLIAGAPLAYRPRSASRYSDLGFILLGHILEEVRQRPLDAQFGDLGLALGIADAIGYRPDVRFGDAIAPTELDRAWRGRLIRGEVQDENAWALGGVAAHAGLFGTAGAVGVIARHILQILRGRSGLVSRATLTRFVTRRAGVPGSSRALGWDTMLPTSSCGVRMSGAAIGHTGFTGTSLWIDPAVDRYAVILSNRVHPSREGEAIQAVRRAVHDAVWTA